MSLVLPNFLIIGAQKAATTAVYAQLKNHPDVFMPDKKELDFFTFGYNYKKGLKFYSSHFGGWNGEKAIGEATPEYLYQQDVPKRIYEAIPNVKLIASLRDPIDRAYSAYLMQLSKGSEPFDRSFEEAVRQEPRYLEYGFYHKHLKRYLEFFCRDQICLFLYDEIKADPQRFCNKLYGFLEIRPLELAETGMRRENLGGMPKIEIVQRFLNVLYKSRNLVQETSMRWIVSNRHVDGLSRRIRNAIATWNRMGGQYPKLNPDSRSRLLPLVSDANNALVDLVGMDLSRWNT